MSLNGWLRLELERQRREQIRLDQVRQECRQIQQACLAEMAKAREPAVQQLARDGMAQVRERLTVLAGNMGADPDKDLKTLKKIQRDLSATLAKAQAAANKWSRQQAESQEALTLAGQAVAVMTTDTGKASRDLADKAAGALSQATVLNGSGRFKEALSLCREVEGLTEKSRQAALDETVRRTVVRGLLQTLQDMGFVVEGPQLTGDGTDGGTVTLAGRLPSGRRARFQVRLDGQLDFDLDGYEGRTCGKQMAAVTQTLLDRFGVKAGPPQITWKNPDRISKGALNDPAGGHSRTTH